MCVVLCSRPTTSVLTFVHRPTTSVLGIVLYSVLVHLLACLLCSCTLFKPVGIYFVNVLELLACLQLVLNRSSIHRCIYCTQCNHHCQQCKSMCSGELVVFFSYTAKTKVGNSHQIWCDCTDAKMPPYLECLSHLLYRWDSPTYTSGTGPLEMVGQHHCIWWGSIKLLLTLFKFKTIFLKQLT